MTTAGDAVLALARTQIGVTENPPGSNNVIYWDWWGGSYGAWCGAFASWCNYEAGYPLCAVDGPKGFILVSNGTYHSYPEGEALPTAQLYPGCTVLFSWYPWVFMNGIPTIVGGEWDGYIAGDHTGIFAYWIDQSTGQFACVEGNTSGSSWDNGGEVWERTDRYASQVCGWWEPPSFGGSPDTPPPQPTSDLIGLGMYLLQNDRRGIWLMGPGYAYGLNEEEYSQVKGIPGIQTFWCGPNERAFDLLYQSCMNGQTAVEN